MKKEKIFMKSAGARGYSPLARVFTLAVMLLTLATTGAWAGGKTVDFPIGNGDNTGWGGSMTRNGIKIQANGSNALFDNSHPTAIFECWQGEEYVTFTISMEDGSDILGVSMTLSGDYIGSFQNLEGWTGSEATRTWSGNAKSVNLRVNGRSEETINLEVTAISVTVPAAAEPGKYTVTMGAEAGEGWTIAPAEATTTGVDKDTKITATYSGTKHVKSVTAVTKAAAPAATVVDLSKLTDDYEAKDGDVLTGTTTAYKMTIADGATVTLDGATISGSSYCIKCAGDATIILKDGSTNTLTSTSEVYPALWAGNAGTTLTIQGSTGALTVQSGKYCAGIGGGYKNTNHTCGNIKIEGGVITATGGLSAAGIGSDCGTATCGNIDITGGTIVATGGSDAAGIGSGYGDQVTASCGNITIKKTVTSVTATKGADAPYSIGKGGGDAASCGTVTIEEGANVTQN